MEPPIEVALRWAEENVKHAQHALDDATHWYAVACKQLGNAKIAYARANPHPWNGMTVYRIMGGDKIRNRFEHGVVCFKDIHTPDYGNPHIAPGSYYVLISTLAGKSAHALTKEWELDLL